MKNTPILILLFLFIFTRKKENEPKEQQLPDNQKKDFDPLSDLNDYLDNQLDKLSTELDKEKHQRQYDE